MTTPSHRYFAGWPHLDDPLMGIAGAQWNPSLRADLRFALAVFAEASKTTADHGLHFLSHEASILRANGASI